MGGLIIKTRMHQNGKCVYEYRFEIAAVNGKRKWKSKSGFTTKREAKEAGKIAQQAYESAGKVMESSDMSYADFLDMWIDLDCKLTCKNSTITGYEKKIRLYIKPALGEYRLKSISKNNLQQFIIKLYNEGFSRNTIISVKGILTKSFDFAVDRNYIQVSPATRLKIPTNLQPKKATRKKPHICLTKDQIDKIFERFPEGNSAYIPLLIAYHTGLRLGETFGLVWDDIDFENKVIKVNRQVQWFQGERDKEEIKQKNGTSESNGYWYFSEPKYKSYRIIDIDDMLMEALRKEYKKQKRAENYYAEYYTRYYVEFPLESGGKKPDYNVSPMNPIGNDAGNVEINFVCRRENGTYISPRTMQHVSNIIHSKLDIPAYDTYSLRHTHGTMLVEQNVDYVYIQRRLGHKDIKVTMNIYTNHLTETMKDRSNHMLNDLYSS